MSQITADLHQAVKLPPIFERIDFNDDADPSIGTVHWSPQKSIWWTSMLVIWVVLGTTYFSWSAVLVFVVLSAVTLCLGLSIGLHRKLIHQSFESSDGLEKVFVYLGTLMGHGGPFTMMRNHDLVEWGQRSVACHPFYSHQSNLLKDFWWQMHCELQLVHPPKFHFPQNMKSNGFYLWLENWSRAQQLPLAIGLLGFGYWYGGPTIAVSWLVWGIAGRIAVSIFGMWIISHFAHNKGDRSHEIAGAAVQGFNVPLVSWLTFGESWHNNHHAYPSSARLGINKGEFDAGWYVLGGLEKLGLVWNLKQPEDLDSRPELRTLHPTISNLSPKSSLTPASIISGFFAGAFVGVFSMVVYFVIMPTFYGSLEVTFLEMIGLVVAGIVWGLIISLIMVIPIVVLGGPVWFLLRQLRLDTIWTALISGLSIPFLVFSVEASFYHALLWGIWGAIVSLTIWCVAYRQYQHSRPALSISS